MNKDSSTPINTFLDEGVAGGKVLNDVLILNVVQFNDQMLVGLEEILV